MNTQPDPLESFPLEPYWVIAADMAMYSSNDMTISCYDCLVTRARDPEDALEDARKSLEDGYAPLAAFTATDLRRMLDELAVCPAKEGEAFNLTKGDGGIVCQRRRAYGRLAR